MGYISFTYDFVKKKLESYEKHGSFAPKEALEEARILLKMIDDVKDEGYTTSYNLMENDFQGVSRLEAFLAKNDFPKFQLEKFTVIENVTYGKEEYSLNTVIPKLASIIDSSYQNPFINKILDYTNWLGNDLDTTYIFLFRDAILPYLAFTKQNPNKALAWLVGRKFLSKYSHDVEDEDEVYDSLHDAIFATLSEGATTEEAYFTTVKAKINTILNDYPELSNDLKELFAKIKTKKIIVVESGYIGTIPTLLKCLDERVDFRMFTTTPYFYAAYNKRIYTKHFEECRLFETIQTADGLLEFADFRNGNFYVHETTNLAVKETSAKEIGYLEQIMK